MDTLNIDALLATDEAAEYAGVKPGTIRQWAYRGYLAPHEHDHAGRPKYKLLDVAKAEHAARSRRSYAAA